MAGAVLVLVEINKSSIKFCYNSFFFNLFNTMSIFASLYDKVIQWSKHRHAPKYLASVSFFESFVFPVPVAVMLLPMCFSQPKKAWFLATLTLIFSVLGGIVGYALGLWAFELVAPIIHSHQSAFDTAQSWFAEYGVWVVVMAGFSPIPYKIFTITSGLLHMPFLPFMIASVIGRASQFYLIAFLISTFGAKMEPKIRQYIEWLGWGVVVLVILIIVGLNYH